MNILNIIMAKVSNTVMVIMVALGLQLAPTPLVESPVVDPVTVVVATATSTEPETAPVSVPFFRSVVVNTTVATITPTSTVTTTPVAEATSSVIVPVVTLPNYQVSPAVAPQTVIIQIQQQEVPVASAPLIMEKTYQLTKGEGESESIVLDNVNEQAIRDFAEGLNQQINWRKQSQTALFSSLTQALKANGYNVIEKE